MPWTLLCGIFHRWECDISLCRVVISTCGSQPPGLRMDLFHVEGVVPVQAILSKARSFLVYCCLKSTVRNINYSFGASDT